MLTPTHSIVDGSDEEAATTKLLGTVDAPPYEKESVASKHGSKHSNLFWKGSHGPHHLTFLMQISMLLSAIVLATMYSWLNAHPMDVVVLLFAFAPVLVLGWSAAYVERPPPACAMCSSHAAG